MRVVLNGECSKYKPSAEELVVLSPFFGTDQTVRLERIYESEDLKSINQVINP